MPSATHSCKASASFASSIPPTLGLGGVGVSTEGDVPFPHLGAVVATLVTTTLSSLFPKIPFSYLSVVSIPT
jgi:hypothetical protein